MKLFRSIKWRLQAWYGGILLLVLAGFGYTAFELQRTRETRRFDQELQERMGAIMSVLRPGPPPPGARRREFRRDEFSPMPMPLGPSPRDPDLEVVLPQFDEGPIYHLVWRRDGRLQSSPNAPEGINRPESRTGSGPRRRGEYRELVQYGPRGEAVVVGRSIRALEQELTALALLLAGAGGAILLAGLAGGWWVARRAMQPVEKISAAAVQIASGDLAHRIPHDETESELGQLAAVLNSTFERLDAAFNEQARFTIDVSHELRTPVSVVLSQTQMTLARERSPEEYRETLEACQRAAQRMRRMIEALLQLARLDAGQEQMERGPFDLASVARESTEMLAPLAAERGLKLSGSYDTAPAHGDAERIAQVITNLVTNAIQYSSPEGHIRVSTRRAEGFAICDVADTGMGIPEEDLPRIFNRFYRVERSRSREKGGTGLGLAISRAIVNAHGGTIEVASRVGQGTTFTVRLPV